MKLEAEGLPNRKEGSEIREYEPLGKWMYSGHLVFIDIIFVFSFIIRLVPI